MDIIGSIIGFILEKSFGLGLFLVDLLDIFDIFKLKKEDKLKEELASYSIKNFIISLIGGFIIMLIIAGVISLIIYFFFKSMW